MLLGDVDNHGGGDGRGDRGACDGHYGDHGGHWIKSTDCQEFKSQCGKFGVRKEEGAEDVARMKLGQNLVGSKLNTFIDLIFR